MEQGKENDKILPVCGGTEEEGSWARGCLTAASLMPLCGGREEGRENGNREGGRVMGGGGGVGRKGGRARAPSHPSPLLFRPWALKDPSFSKEVL